VIKTYIFLSRIRVRSGVRSGVRTCVRTAYWRSYCVLAFVLVAEVTSSIIVSPCWAFERQDFRSTFYFCLILSDDVALLDVRLTTGVRVVSMPLASRTFDNQVARKAVGAQARTCASPSPTPLPSVSPPAPLPLTPRPSVFPPSVRQPTVRYPRPPPPVDGFGVLIASSSYEI